MTTPDWSDFSDAELRARILQRHDDLAPDDVSWVVANRDEEQGAAVVRFLLRDP